MKTKNYDLSFLRDDCELRSYFLGLLMADGSFNHKRGDVRFSMSDKQIIKDLAIITNYRNKISESKNWTGFGKGSTSFAISFCNKEVAEFLRDEGFINKKTGNEFIPSCISEKTFFHFLRGLFDGDGCITYCANKRTGKKYLSFDITSQSEQFLTNILNTLRRFDVISSKSNVTINYGSKNNDCFRIRLGHKDSISVCKRMYEVSNIKLERKYNKYLDGSKETSSGWSLWSKSEIEMALSGEIPKGRTKGVCRYIIRKYGS